MSGVVLFWIVAFVLTAGGGLDVELPVSSAVLLAIVIAAAVGAFGAALAMRSKVTAALADPALRDPQSANASSVLTRLISAWALLEGQGILAGVLFMLTGNASLLIIPALVFISGFALTFPKPGWFAPQSQTRQP